MRRLLVLVVMLSVGLTADAMMNTKIIKLGDENAHCVTYGRGTIIVMKFKNNNTYTAYELRSGKAFPLMNAQTLFDELEDAHNKQEAEIVIEEKKEEKKA